MATNSALFHVKRWRYRSCRMSTVSPIGAVALSSSVAVARSRGSTDCVFAMISARSSDDLPYGLSSSRFDSAEHHVERCREQDDVMQCGVELPLVRDGSRDDHIVMSPQQFRHPFGDPVAGGILPADVICVDCESASPGELPDHG